MDQETLENGQTNEEYPVRCIRERELNKIFGCSDTTRKRLVKSPGFPKPFRLNRTFKVWNSNDIYAWLEQRQREYSAE